MVQKTVVRARLRQGKDDDLRAAVEEHIAHGHDEADLVRAGLRLLFGLETSNPVVYHTKAVEQRPAAPTAKKEVKKPKAPGIEKMSNNQVDNYDDDLDRLLGL